MSDLNSVYKHFYKKFQCCDLLLSLLEVWVKEKKWKDDLTEYTWNSVKNYNPGVHRHSSIKQVKYIKYPSF